MTSSTIETASAEPRNRPVWLFSAPVDLGVFLGSALLSFGLLAYGAYAGLLHADTPEWAWVPFVLLVDVAHVYATGFRVYFDREELQRRPMLYFGTPVIAFIVGLALHSENPQWFWRVLAYLAVFHFVRQQYGWVAMYRAKAGEPDGWQKWIDTATIYLATLHPLAYWHANLPRRFWWFRDWDFHSVPEAIVLVTGVLYWTAIAAYCLKAIWQWRIGKANPGKDIVVLTTVLCWRLGIITFNSDYAFTVTNVIIHGVPYFALVYWYVRMRSGPSRPNLGWAGTLATLLATVWLLAYVEELVWDQTVWQERSWLFGAAWFDGEGASQANGFLTWLPPLLAVPQITHYVLDGFIWRRRSNPQLNAMSGAPAAPTGS